MSSAIPAPRRVFRGRLARTLLLILLVLSLVPQLVMGSMAYLRARGLLREQFFTLLTAVVDSQGQQIASRISTGHLLLSRELANPNLIQALETGLQQDNPDSPLFNSSRQNLFNDLQTINQPKPFFNQFLVVKPDGRIHMASKREWEGKSIAESPYFSRLMGQQTSLALFAPQPLYQESFVILTPVPYLDQNGNLAAMILGVSESPTIRDLIDNVAFFSTNQYFVTADGQFLEANPFPNSFEKLVRFDPSDEQKRVIQGGLLTGNQDGTAEFVAQNNEPVLAAYKWLPALDIGWVAEVSETSIYTQINALLLFAVLLFFAIAMLMALIIWLTTRRMVRPLLELNQTVQSYADGYWEKRASVRRNDEIGQLSNSFNLMADELSDLYYSLEMKVEERTFQIRTAAETSQIAISSTSLEELLKRTTRLVLERFGFAYAAVFLLDKSGRYAVYQEAAGPSDFVKAMMGYRVEVDEQTTIGWVITSNQPRVNALEPGVPAPASQEKGLLANAQAEAGIPISVGDQVLGMFHLQSYKPAQLNEDNLSKLQDLVNQVAPAIRSFQLLEATQIDLQETNLLYQASHQIAQAETVEQIIQVAAQALKQTQYASVLLLPDGNQLQVAFKTAFKKEQEHLIAEQLSLTPDEVEAYLPSQALVLITDFERPPNLPMQLLDLARGMGGDSAAVLPVIRAEKLAALLLLGARKEAVRNKRFFTPSSLQPYVNLIELTSMALEKAQALQNTQKRLTELQTLSAVSQGLSIETDLQALFTVLHEQINQVMGKVDFFIALYDSQTNTIRIPYMMENGESLEVSPFPLGEGLTSILIRTRQPLILVEDVETKALALGAKVAGEQAKSWLGIPLLIGGEAIGAMVVQDSERENRFSEDDLRLMNTLAGQVAVAVRNTQLLESTRRKADRERLLFEITSKIRRSTDINTILQTTASELGTALGARRAHIEVKTENEPPPPSGGNGHADEEPGDE